MYQRNLTDNDGLIPFIPLHISGLEKGRLPFELAADRVVPQVFFIFLYYIYFITLCSFLSWPVQLWQHLPLAGEPEAMCEQLSFCPANTPRLWIHEDKNGKAHKKKESHLPALFFFSLLHIVSLDACIAKITNSPATQHEPSTANPCARCGKSCSMRKKPKKPGDRPSSLRVRSAMPFAIPMWVTTCLSVTTTLTSISLGFRLFFCVCGY